MLPAFLLSFERRFDSCRPLAPLYSIIQRAGVVPLSVAGVFKEVTTISIASWAFGDELTPVNFAGLFVTMIGAFPALPVYSYRTQG